MMEIPLRPIERVRAAPSGPVLKVWMFSGMPRRQFCRIHRLLTLKDHNVLTAEEEERVDRALALLEERKYDEAQLLTKDVVRNHPTFRNKDQVTENKTENKKLKRLDSTVFTIYEACTNNDELEVPQLSAADRNRLVTALTESLGSLCELFIKVKGASHEAGN